MRHTSIMGRGFLAVAATALLLAGCGQGQGESGSRETVKEQASSDMTLGEATDKVEATLSEASYPIIMEHAYGTTTIQEKPERIATVAWGNHDVPLALGIAPVGVSMANFGKKDADGLLTWTGKAFEELGVKPHVFQDTDGLDFEAIADTKPDVILAAYSGMTKEDYETLSQIAPVLPYKKAAWQTSWRDTTIEDATAMGMETEGRALVEETEAFIKEKLSEHKSIEGKKAAFAYMDVSDLSKFYIYLPLDPRAGFLQDLGLQLPSSVEKLMGEDAEFSVTVSAEQADKLSDIDVLVCYGDDKTVEALQKDARLSQIPAIKNGAVVIIENESDLAGAATPSVLSIRATLDQYLQKLEEASAKVK